MVNNLKRKIVVNLAWKFTETCGSQFVSFVVSIILARLLAPSDYGTIALVTVITNILSVFVESGFGSALIQKKDVDTLDFSSVFWCNVTICLTMYAGLAFIAPHVAYFYNNDKLTPIVRAIGLTMVLSGFGVTQRAYIQRNLMFKYSFFASIGSCLISAVVGISMACRGFGVWALVAQQLIASVMNTAILWVTSSWRPRFIFSWKRLSVLFSFGWRLLASSLLHTFYTNFRQLLVGKFYSSTDLGLFNRGQTFPSIIVSNVNSTIGSVMFPVMSSCQDNVAQVRRITRRMIVVSSYLMWPLMMGIAATGETLVTLLLGEKWIACVPFMIAFCFALGLEPMQTANLAAMKALGRSDIYFKLEIIKKCTAIAIAIIAVQVNVFVLCVSAAVYSVVASIINSTPNRKLLDYSYFQQIHDILPSFVLAIVMGMIIWLCPMPDFPLATVLLIQIFLGVGIYLVGSFIFHLEGLVEVKDVMSEMLRSKGYK